MSKLVPYLGGKRLLAKKIVKLLPQHDLYCEVLGVLRQFCSKSQ